MDVGDEYVGDTDVGKGAVRSTALEAGKVAVKDG